MLGEQNFKLQCDYSESRNVSRKLRFVNTEIKRDYYLFIIDFQHTESNL